MVPPGALDTLRSNLDEFYHQEKTLVYRTAVTNSAFAKSLRDKTARFSLSKARIIHDSAKKMNKSDPDWKEELLISQLAPDIKDASSAFVLVSPYFVPGGNGADAICKLADQGVRVRILTNSLASNDVAAV